MPKRKIQVLSAVVSKRRRYRRRRRVGYIRRGSTRLNNNMHAYKRTFQGSDINVNNVSTLLGALDFKFNQLPDYTDFTTLYDQYKICGIRVDFVPSCTGSDINPVSTIINIPNIFTTVDYDDANVPGSLNEILQYPRRRMHKMTSRFSIYWRPCVAAEIFKSAVTTGYSARKSPWLDQANTDIPHYGLKWAIDQNFASATNLTMKTYVTYYFKCKGVR